MVFRALKFAMLKTKGEPGFKWTLQTFMYIEILIAVVA